MTATRGPDLDVAPREPGAWNGPVTSYYLLIGATGLLLSIGLVMVLSSSTVDSLTASKGATPYSVFLNQAQFALIGLPIAWVASRLPVRFYRAIAWPALAAAVALQLLVFTSLGIEANGNRNWIGVGSVHGCSRRRSSSWRSRCGWAACWPPSAPCCTGGCT